MLAIRNAVRCLFALANLQTIRAALQRLRGRQPSPPPAPPCPLAEAADEQPYEEPDEAMDETEDTLADWDTDRAEKLHQAEEYEREGLRLLASAALLRVAIGCDDRGETFIAEELREHAQSLDTEYVDALSAEDVWEPTTTRLVPARIVPANHGA